jgi:hypothetical protein
MLGTPRCSLEGYCDARPDRQVLGLAEALVLLIQVEALSATPVGLGLTTFHLSAFFLNAFFVVRNLQHNMVENCTEPRFTWKNAETM